MGDMADVFNDLKKHKKEQRAIRAESNAGRLAALGINAYEQSKNVFRIGIGEREVVRYYPSSGKWQHRGRVHHGSPAQLKTWLETHVAYDASTVQD